MIRLCRRLSALLLVALCLAGVAIAQEPVYGSARSFVARLREGGVAYVAEGVDEDGDDCIAVEWDGFTILCFFGKDGESASFIVWYLIDYAAADELAVIRACNGLNAVSGGPVFYADGSDCSVTAVLDLVLPWDAAGEVAWRGFRAMTNMLPAARNALSAYDTTPDAPVATPAPTATPAPARPPVPTRTPMSTATPAPVNTPASMVTPAVSSVIITAETARVRTGPSVTSPYLCTAKMGDVFPVIGVSGDWYIIDCGGRTGFVSMSVARVQ